jgi:hypothetical protein
VRLDGASSVGAAIRDFVDGLSGGPPGYERAVVNADLSITPDSWNGNPFVQPGDGNDGVLEYMVSARLIEGESEPGLVGVTDSPGGASLEHTHPNRTLQPGDRVLMVWLEHGTPKQRPYVVDVAG